MEIVFYNGLAFHTQSRKKTDVDREQTMASENTTWVSQTPIYYWGEGGEYGPFRMQQEGPWAGWPDFGQVMRYFRKKVAKLSGPEFGELYGKAVNADGSAFSKRWIYDMEMNNLGPVDFGRRKIIADLLHIPPTLFGLAALEDGTLITDPPKSCPVISGLSTLKRLATDIDKYQADIRLRWQLHSTSTARDTTATLEMDVYMLEQLEAQAKGDFLYHIQNILFGNYYLASVLAEDEMQYDQCYAYANNAVRVAKAMNDPELVATAHYARGYARLNWALYGTCNESGIFVVNHKLLADAVRDFEKAKDGAHPQLLGVIMIGLSEVQAHLRMKKAPFTSLDLAADQIGRDHIHDPYQRILVTGTYSGFHEGRYRVKRVKALNAAGEPTLALKDIREFRKLNGNTYGADETRRFAWIDILEAESRLQLKDYYQATECAKRALRVYQYLHIVSHIGIITELYGRLLNSPYQHSTDVEELGVMIGKRR